MIKILLIFLIKSILGDEADTMNYICDNIYLGDSVAASDEDFLKEYNISTVVNCAADYTSIYKDIKFMELKLYDSDNQNLFPKFEIAYKFIKTNSKNNNNILIHCMLGMSRSSSLVIFYLMKERKWDFDTCYNFVKEKRPIIDPIYGFEKQLREYYDKYIK